MELPFVSIVIASRNEEAFIGKCLDSVLANNYPKNKLEVLVIDGASQDRTRDIVNGYSKHFPFIKLIDNYKRIAPVAFNIGIRAAKGQYVIILGSHSRVDDNFIKTNIESFYKYNVDCVGGIIKTIAANNTLIARSIALVISHPFGVGNSYFRIGVKEPRFVDTVPFGCYKKEVFEKIGYFDEDLVRNQDDEFNLRLIKNGGKILLVPEIVSYYYARDSSKNLWRMYFQYGYFKPLCALKVGAVLTLRQVIPVVFVLSLILSGMFAILFKPFLLIFGLVLAIYVGVNLFFSFQLAEKNSLGYMLVLPVTFAVIHFSYGVGYLCGIFDFVVLNKHKMKKIKDISLTR